MIAEPVLFRDLAYVFLAAVLGGALARLAHQPSILGYVFGGLLVSPLTPGPSVTDVHTFQAFAEIGVVLLMFSLGIEFSLKDLLGVKWIALVGAPLGMALSIGLTLTTGAGLGWSPLQGAVVGIGLGAAALTQAAGLSLALGAFLAGLLINESDYAHEMLARVLSLRDAFTALFFVTIGVLIDPHVVAANLGLLGALVGLIVIGDWALWATVCLAFRQSLFTAVRVGLGLAQIGEFSFILVGVARQSGHVDHDMYSATLAASLVTVLVNAALVRLVARWLGPPRHEDRGTLGRPSGEGLDGHVVVCGFGRVGSAIGEALETFGVPYVAIETDPDIVKSLRARGVPAVFGDAAQRIILAAARAERAALVILTVPETERARLAVLRLRALNPGAPVLARAWDLAGRDRLAEEGAAEGIQPGLEAAATLIRHALERLSLPRDQVLAYLNRYRGAMESLGAGGEIPGAGLPRLHEVTLRGGDLVDQSLREARVRERFGVTVVAVTRASGETVLHPTADTVLRAGDRLRLFGLPQKIDGLLAGSEVLSE